ncbi:MAG: DUF4838 domain-containing protein [Puniceicoccaceae bacterium]
MPKLRFNASPKIACLAGAIVCLAAVAEAFPRAGSRPVEKFPGFFEVFGADAGARPAVILLPPGSPGRLQSAAAEFRARVRAMGGPEVPLVVSTEPPVGVPVIRFEETRFPRSLLFPAGTDDRFRIEAGPRVVSILAAEPIGWEFGLYTLLDEFGGVRWFWPGESGTHTPVRNHWRIPYGAYDYEPAYVSRKLWPGRTEDEKRWSRHNRLKPVFQYNHNLRSIFDREFFLNHPETLAVEWDPDDPPGAGHPLWQSQPDLTSETVVEAAAGAAVSAFRDNPGRISFSLGINDNTRFGDSPGIRSATRPMRYFRDLPDYSDLVFGFMNRVAERVAPLFPDRFLGCLSYMWVENTPSFPVHPMVLPYLTADRSQGYDVSFTEEDRELIRRWTRAGPRLIGIYDYLHGAPHSFPRRANLLVGQRIRDAHASGARAYFAELSPIWPFHGDLPWMVARMLWDPSLDPGALETEFVESFFGPAAAPMSRFYTRAREVWMSQEGTATWVKYFRDEAGIELFDAATRSAMASDLEDAGNLAKDRGVHEERVAAVATAWELTEAEARLQEARRALVDPENPPRNPGPVLEFLNARKDAAATFARLREHPWTAAVVKNAFPRSDPTYHAVRSLLESAAESRRPALLAELLAGADRLDDDAALLIIRLAHRAAVRSGETLVEACPLRPAAGEITKTGPEPWEIDLAQPWDLPIDPSQKLRLGYAGGDAEAPLRIESAYAAGLSWEFTPAPGRFYEAVAEIAGVVSLGNRTSLAFQWWGEKDRPLGSTRALRLPAREREVEGEFAVFGLAPEGAVRGAVVLATVRQEKGDWLEVSGLVVRSFSTRPR